MLRINTTNHSEIMNIRDILKFITFNSWLLLDLDNTVMETRRELGSDQWFVKLIEQACRLYPENSKEAIEWVIEIYTAVQHYVNTIVVEQDIVWLIKTLQDIGIPVIGVTARDHSLVHTTFRQLQENNINFGRTRDAHEHLIHLGNTKNKIIYHNGIIFCSGNNKDICIQALFQICDKLPEHAVMVDDKGKHLEHVKNFLEGLGIRFHGLRYGFLDEKIKSVNMEEAHLQLAHIKDQLPKPIQHYIEKLNLKPKEEKLDHARYSDFFATNPHKRTIYSRAESPITETPEPQTACFQLTTKPSAKRASSLSVFAPKRRKVEPKIQPERVEMKPH